MITVQAVERFCQLRHEESPHRLQRRRRFTERYRW